MMVNQGQQQGQQPNQLPPPQQQMSLPGQQPNIQQQQQLQQGQGPQGQPNQQTLANMMSGVGPGQRPPIQMMGQNVNLRPGGMPMQGPPPQQQQLIRPGPGASPFQPPPSASPSMQQPSPSLRHSIPSPATTPQQGQGAPSPMPVQQNIPSSQQQQQQQQLQQGPLPSVVQSNALLNEQIGAQVLPGQQMQPGLPGQGGPNAQANKDRRKVVWGGIVEYQEKIPPPAPGQPNVPQVGNRITYTLQCQISCSITNGEPEVNADKWPEKLVLQLLPRNLIMKLFGILKSGSVHVGLHFSNPESEGLQKLSKSMSMQFVGCVQFQGMSPIRMMIVIYMPDKRLFMGFIPNDQEGFFTAMKQMIEQHKKEQQSKQKMVSFEYGIYFRLWYFVGFKMVRFNRVICWVVVKNIGYLTFLGCSW